MAAARTIIWEVTQRPGPRLPSDYPTAASHGAGRLSGRLTCASSPALAGGQRSTPECAPCLICATTRSQAALPLELRVPPNTAAPSQPQGRRSGPKKYSAPVLSTVHRGETPALGGCPCRHRASPAGRDDLPLRAATALAWALFWFFPWPGSPPMRSSRTTNSATARPGRSAQRWAS